MLVVARALSFEPVASVEAAPARGARDATFRHLGAWEQTQP